MGLADYRTIALPDSRLPVDAALLIFVAAGLAAIGGRLKLGLRASRGRSSLLVA